MQNTKQYLSACFSVNQQVDIFLGSQPIFLWTSPPTTGGGEKLRSVLHICFSFCWPATLSKPHTPKAACENLSQHVLPCYKSFNVERIKWTPAEHLLAIRWESNPERTHTQYSKKMQTTRLYINVSQWFSDCLRHSFSLSSRVTFTGTEWQADDKSSHVNSSAMLYVLYAKC